MCQEGISMIYKNSSQTFYTTPETDGAMDIVINVLKSAQHKTIIAAYSLTVKEIADELRNQFIRGYDVKGIFDKTEAGNRSEKPLLADLAAAGVPIIIGKSQKHRSHAPQNSGS